MEGYSRRSLRLCELSGCVMGILTPSHKRFQRIGLHIRMSHGQHFKQSACFLVDLCVQLGHFVVYHLTRRGGLPSELNQEEWQGYCHLVHSHVPEG